MTSSGLIAIAAALSIAISTIAPAIGQGMTASKAMDAIARQPEAAGDIRSSRRRYPLDPDSVHGPDGGADDLRPADRLHAGGENLIPSIDRGERRRP